MKNILHYALELFCILGTFLFCWALLILLFCL